MDFKPLVIFTAISFCLQVLLSIFYSIKIVDQSQVANNLNKELTQVIVKNQQLEIQLSQLSSLSHLVNSNQNQNYIPITTVINLY